MRHSVTRHRERCYWILNFSFGHIGTRRKKTGMKCKFSGISQLPSWHTYALSKHMINWLTMKTGTGMWDLKQRLWNLFRESNAEGLRRKRHPCSLNSHLLHHPSPTVFSVTAIDNSVFCTLQKSNSIFWWVFIYSCIMFHCSLEQNRLVLFSVVYQGGWSFSYGRAFVSPLQKLRCSESGRHHYRDFSMPGPVSYAQNLELLGSRYISSLKANHGELGSKDFQIFNPQQHTSNTLAGGLSYCKAFKQNKTSALSYLQHLMQIIKEAEERGDAQPITNSCLMSRQKMLKSTWNLK